MRKILLLSFIATAVFGQQKVSLIDVDKLLTDNVKVNLADNLAAQGYTLEKFIDSENGCDYVYTSLVIQQEDQVALVARDCRDDLLGIQRTSLDRFNSYNNQQKASWVTLNLIDIILFPGYYGVEEGAQKSQEAVDTINQHVSRNFINPTAYPQPKNSLYYENAYLLINGVSYGFSERFSAGIMFPIIPVPIMIQAKYSFPFSEKLAVAIGNQTLVILEDFQVANHTFINASLGSQYINITAGIGYMNISEGGWWLDPVHTPVFQLGGMWRVNRNGGFYLISENFYMPARTIDTFWQPVGISNSIIRSYSFTKHYAAGFLGGKYHFTNKPNISLNGGFIYLLEHDGQPDTPDLPDWQVGWTTFIPLPVLGISIMID